MVSGEFGRTPKTNSGAGGGRDHWPRAFSALLAGGGIRGGQVYGRTDAVAGTVQESPMRPDDLAATLYEALGIAADTTILDSFQRPRRITEGQPVKAFLDKSDQRPRQPTVVLVAMFIDTVSPGPPADYSPSIDWGGTAGAAPTGSGLGLTPGSVGRYDRA